MWKVLLFLSFLQASYGAKILAVFPVASPSHFILGNAYLRGLANAGHDTTMISPFTNKIPVQNGTYRDIVLTGFKEQHEKLFEQVNFFKLENNLTLSIIQILKMTHHTTEAFLNHTNIQELINSNEKFDVVVAGQFVNDAVKALANHFNAHLIVFSSIGVNPLVGDLVGNPSPPSYIPDVFLNFSPKMSFLQRLQNFVFQFAKQFFMYWVYTPNQRYLKDKYFPDTPSYDEIIYNASLVLCNGHESTNNPVPMVPNIINIGGFHVEVSNELKGDLKKFLDEAQEGVIYFSMGSNLRSKDIPEEIRKEILNVLGGLKEKVLWKFESDLPDKPDNVRIEKWLPQQEILAHPNVKAFITHGGLLSTIETVYHGVPIVAIPIFGDQRMNAQTAQQNGYGIVLPLSELNEQTLRASIQEILTNPSYTKEVKKRSALMRDRPMQPLASAVYWTEFIIRHNGAQHLRVQGANLPWYQYHSLDVISLILAIIYITCKIVIKLFSYCFSCSKKVKTD